MLGCSLEAVTSVLPEDYLGNRGMTTPDRLAGGLVHSHFLVCSYFSDVTLRLLQKGASENFNITRDITASSEL